MSTTIQDNKIIEGYKQTSVGVIPKNWNVKRLEDLSSHFKSGSGITSRSIEEVGEFPVYGGNGLRGYTSTFTHNGKYLLIGRQGALCGNIQKVEGKTYISEHAIAVQTNDQNDLEFLASKLEYYNLNRLSESSAQPGLAVNKLVRLRLPIPPLPEQKAIADCLSTWDKGIEKLSALIASKKEQKKGLMQQLLTGKKRLDGFTEEWKEMELSEILKESKIVSTENDKSKRISVRLHLEGVHKRPVRGTEADSTTFYKRKAGQFIYGKQNFHNGSLGIIPKELDGFETTSDIPSFDINDKVNHEWFFYYISRFDFYTKMESKTTGTGSKRLHPRELFSTKIPKLSIEEQTVIAEMLSTGGKEIELLEKKLESFKTQKKGLMQMLLTGEKRLV